MKLKKLCSILLVMVLVFSVLSTFNQTIVPVQAKKTVKITKVVLNKTSKTITKGKTYQLKATIKPSNTTQSKKLKWTSSNKSVATVSSKGKVTAKKKGTATITVNTSNGKKAKCKIIVKNPTTTKSQSVVTNHAGGKIICIDAGHQAKGNSAKEPNGPGSSVKKAKVTTGTRGVKTKVLESELNLKIALMLKKELVSRGYQVVMVRESQNVNISNVERAEIANKAKADANIRIHADGVDNSSAQGFSLLTPSSKNKYLSSSLVNSSYKLSSAISKAYGSSTGFKNRGISYRDDLTGTNWSKVPTTLLELGFMSNASEDVKMNTASYQKKMVTGIANGIDNYFK